MGKSKSTHMIRYTDMITCIVYMCTWEWEKIRKAEEGAKANMSETEHEIHKIMRILQKNPCMCACVCLSIYIIIWWFGSWNKI